jgi:hypothetical protein
VDKAQAIATWAEQLKSNSVHARANKDRNKLAKPDKRSNAERIVTILRLSAQGHTQAFIAGELGITQGAVSQTLAKYQRNTTKDARQILEAKAADMALNVAKHGRPADQLRALEGLNVITPGGDQIKAGLSITINGFALVGLGLGESPQKPQQIATESDKQSYVNEANSLIIDSIAEPARTDGESGRGIDGGPSPLGDG